MPEQASDDLRNDPKLSDANPGSKADSDVQAEIKQLDDELADRLAVDPARNDVKG